MVVQVAADLVEIVALVVLAAVAALAEVALPGGGKHEHQTHYKTSRHDPLAGQARIPKTDAGDY